MNLDSNNVKEVIFIGLSGLTHHYGGLSPDNVASEQNSGSESSPRQAALQAIALMRKLLSLGIIVGVIPPQLRPDLEALQKQGFSIENSPINLLEQVSSSSFMWVANAATITPAWDSNDGNLHLTAANLHTNPHRRIEAQNTFNTLRKIFSGVPNAIIHPPLDASIGFLDEGAANHMLFAPNHAANGLHIFVYGGRQNLQASQAIATNHQIPEEQVLFIEQSPDVIKQGVFHNDVIAVSNENIFLVHELAYKNGTDDIKRIKDAYNFLHPEKLLQLIIIKNEDLEVGEAVGSYFFNSQIVTKPDGRMAIIAPMELKTLYEGKAAKLMEKIKDDPANSIDEVIYLDLKQSMRNGGGPACLRLRVPMTQEQIDSMKDSNNILVNDEILTKIERLVEKYYPEKLKPADLRDIDLYHNNQKFLSELDAIFYPPSCCG